MTRSRLRSNGLVIIQSVTNGASQLMLIIHHAPTRKEARISHSYSSMDHVCSESCCILPARNRNPPYWCEMHYMRLRRTGSTSLTPPKSVYYHTGGYVIIRCPDHPLCKRSGRNLEYEHRVIFHDTHGEGPFSCHWCSNSLTWTTLDIDHVDENKTNNDPSNLVASCPPCNRRRSIGIMKSAMRERSTHITLNGIRRSVYDWAALSGIPPHRIRSRLRTGVSPELILSPERLRPRRK